MAYIYLIRTSNIILQKNTYILSKNPKMRESELVLNGSYSKSTQPKARAPPEQPALLTIYLTFMFNKK